MTGDELLKELADAGLEPAWTEKGLRLRGQLDNFTPELKRLMKLHREWLEDHFRPKTGNTMPRAIEFKWEGTGLVADRWKPGLGQPVPDYWRYVGENDDAWKPTPRRVE